MIIYVVEHVRAYEGNSVIGYFKTQKSARKCKAEAQKKLHDDNILLYKDIHASDEPLKQSIKEFLAEQAEWEYINIHKEVVQD